MAYIKTIGIILYIGTGAMFEKAHRRWNVPGVELRCYNGLNSADIKFLGYTKDGSAAMIKHYDVKAIIEVLDARIANGTNMPSKESEVTND